jgi:hypothetical protein
MALPSGGVYSAGLSAAPIVSAAAGVAEWMVGQLTGALVSVYDSISTACCVAASLVLRVAGVASGDTGSRGHQLELVAAAAAHRRAGECAVVHKHCLLVLLVMLMLRVGRTGGRGCTSWSWKRQQHMTGAASPVGGTGGRGCTS